MGSIQSCKCVLHVPWIMSQNHEKIWREVINIDFVCIGQRFPPLNPNLSPSLKLVHNNLSFYHATAHLGIKQKNIAVNKALKPQVNTFQYKHQQCNNWKQQVESHTTENVGACRKRTCKTWLLTHRRTPHTANPMTITCTIKSVKTELLYKNGQEKKIQWPIATVIS
jgi:hypothetical protein